MSDSERTPEEIEELNRRREMSGTPAKGDKPASKDVTASVTGPDPMGGGVG